MELAEVIEQVARDSYGRLLAILAAPTGDIPAAEDALSEAFVQALRSWPAGAPTNPEGWLLTVARNRLRDLYKSAAYRSSSELTDAAASLDDVDLDAIPDKRLVLLFTCAHPAIDAGIRAPLMLQTVLGIEAGRIATAFAVPSATMAQRLVRAKKRIRDTRIRFAVPDRSEMASRLPPVLEAIYGAFAVDRFADGDLDAEALYLALTLVDLLDDPEVLGLAALLSFSMSRPALDDYVPLDQQDTSTWNAALIAQGETLLTRAQSFGTIGRFQLEAAIQSVHAHRARTGRIDYAALGTLYAGLVQIAPTLGARVSHAMAVAELEGAAAGLAALDALGDVEFQPLWAARAHLLALAGDSDAAASAYDRAIDLTDDPRVQAFLRARR